MKKMLLLVNPTAGQKKIMRHLGDVIALFNRADYEVTVFMTAYSGHGTEIIEKRCRDYDIIVCAGGDGTLNEVITGLLHAGADTPIGYIPCGSTNDFATTLKLPLHVMEAARCVVEGVPMPHDVGRFDNRYFSYVASFGAFTRASYATPQNVKNALGHLAYWLEGISELTQIRPAHARFEYDGNMVEGDFIFGAISNTTSVGGVLTLDPRQVDLQDGKFELLLVRMPRDAGELKELLRALTEQKYCCNVITFNSFSRLTAHFPENLVWSLDGERAEGHNRVEIENLCHAVSIVHKPTEALPKGEKK